LAPSLKIAVNTRFLLKNRLEGFGHFTNETLKRITQQHPEVQFYFLFDRPYDSSYIYGPNVKAVVLPPQARHPFLWYLWFELSTAIWLKINKPDLYLCMDGYACMNTSIKQVTVIHDLAFEHFDNNIKSYQLRYMRKNSPMFANKVDRIATVSEFSKQDIVEKYKIKVDKIDVVYNGANHLYKVLDDTEKLKIKEQYTNGHDYFVYVGSIHPRKNVKRLLEAFDNYKTQSGGNKKLLVVGRMAWQTSDVNDTVQAMKHKSDVIFTGYVSDEELAKCVGAAFALCYVSLFEGFGIPIIEAMKSGVPVICSNITSMLEVGLNASIQVNPYQTKEITNVMLLLDKDNDVRLSLIQKGLQRQLDFTWDKTAQKLWDCCVKVIGSRSTASVISSEDEK
jgi:glycosyltransferase involved in cell wall biosynthesis